MARARVDVESKKSMVGLAEVAAREHIEEIRTKKFSIGAKEPNPLTHDLHRAVTSLSAELYTKDVHFLMELIQNAEDNEYEEGVKPTLEFVLTKRDITGSKAPATLLVFNNEVGFSRQNMSSLCSVGRSTKKGKRDQGFIGEKGIGFKSVFVVSKEPHIVSNGYRVKFNEEPDRSCGIGYIVPEWVGDKSFLSKIHVVYGSNRVLPSTMIILPLKVEKVEPVKEQLLQLHPELLLFLFKIKRLRVRGSNSLYKDATDVCAISISHETDHVIMQSKKAESRVVHLSVNEKPDSSDETCQYFIWRQSFPVNPVSKVSGREDVDKFAISLAFPFGDRLTRGTSHSAGIFAFLPTTMVTNFPFIIQADFLLASSRESILLDSKWNLGILKCVPSAFVNAFAYFLKEGAPLFTASEAFKFLPAKDSSIAELNDVKENIRLLLCEAKSMPCETFTGDLKLCKPVSAVRILYDFRQLLIQMKAKGISLDGLASLKNHPIDSSLDMEEYDDILDFLYVPSVSESSSWYGKCISACKLISQASENDYINLLYIFADNEELFLEPFFMKNHLFKYTNQMGVVELCSASKTKKDGHKIWFAMESDLHAWLSTCSLEFKCPSNVFFLPNSTQAALVGHEQKSVLIDWLACHANIVSCSAYDYCSSVRDYILTNLEKNLLVMFTRFLYHSHKKGFISQSELSCLFVSTPVIDGSNSIRTGPRKALVFAEGSKWVKLFGPSNPFSQYGYCDLGGVYCTSGHFAGEYTPGDSLLNMLTVHTGALDLPEFCPPNIALSVASSKLTSEQAFLLLDWIQFLRTQRTSLPAKFIASVRNGKWMKTYSGFDSPSKSILPNEVGKSIFEMTFCVLNDLSILDESYYENHIIRYLDDLKYLGVTSELNDLQKVAMTRFKAAASSVMSKTCVFSLLTFIGFLQERNMLDEKWLMTMRQGRWLKTSQGGTAPNRSVFLSSESEFEAVCRITDIPVIDRNFYGSKFDTFSSELSLLGVKLDVEVYRLVPEKISFRDVPASLTNCCALFILQCVRSLQPGPDASVLIEKVKKQSWLKTSAGFQCPSSAVLPSPELGCLLNIVELPIIDEAYYGGSIRLYVKELRELGVALDFDSALKIVTEQIHVLSTSSNMSPSKILSLLQGVKDMCTIMPSQLNQIREALKAEALFKTHLGYRMPSQSILSNHSWASISPFVDLPTIDDSYYGCKIYDYQVELEVLGVIIGLEEGANFVVEGLKKPIKAGQMTAEGAISLLKCIRRLMCLPGEQCSVDSFLEIIMGSECLRSTCGDKSPKQCVLFKLEWNDILECTDLPFLDDTYYGNRISEYQSELKAIGVKVDAMDICATLSDNLYSLTKTSSVMRFYRFLLTYSWGPGYPDKSDSQVWIPDPKGSDSGQWVSSKLCIVHDKDNLFGALFYCLDNYYDKELLPIFPQAFGVADCPGLSHYMQLWVSWSKRENHELSAPECWSFWRNILDNWRSETEEALKQNLTELPAISTSCKGIQLVKKEKLYLPDHLLLKRMFLSLDESPPFVWLPSYNISSSVTAARLNKVYSLLGVKNLSESVVCYVETFQVFNQESMLELRNKIISRGLLKIVLGYLACPKVNMDVKSRHRAAKSLLTLSVSVTNMPIQVRYQLHPPNCKPLEVESHKVVHWERKSHSLLINKSSYDKRNLTMEFASYFSQELAEGLLNGDNPKAVDDLRKIIQLGCYYEFEQDSVEFLLTRENLELFTEDDIFLQDAFPSDQLQVVGYGKRICPSTPVPCVKRQRHHSPR